MGFMPNTLFTGKVYLRFDELASTNDYAVDWIARRNKLTSKSKPPEGTVVRADSQSAGRGQYGSTWESEPGKNLTLSVILYPTWLEATAPFLLNMAVTLAVIDALPPIGVKAKWPNDLYVDDRKIGGVLIQNSLSSKGIQSSVVGIGLNVNQTVFQSDAPNPGSLAGLTGIEYDLDALADNLFEHLEKRYLELRAGNRDEIHATYESRLYRLHETASYQKLPERTGFAGIILGVTDQGLLRMETSRGEQHFQLKELRFI
jgi:BirA family biotin operon repressor/biotin-[acetyl-CoA-carboxylase] ligase